jgi:polyhydroxyalkanoate synthesis regulator phasin
VPKLIDDIMEKGGICATGCACIGCMGGTAAGVVTWIYLIWPAMGANSALNGLGQYLITLLGPGEAYVAAWLIGGTVGLALLGCCVGAVTGCGMHNTHDLTPDDIEMGLGNKTTIERLGKASQEITAALANLKQKAADGSMDENTTQAEVSKISMSLVSKGLIKPEEAENFEAGVKKVISNDLTQAEIKKLNAQVEQTRVNSPIVSAHVKSTFSGALNSVSTFSTGSAASTTVADAKPDDELELREIVVHKM